MIVPAPDTKWTDAVTTFVHAPDPSDVIRDVCTKYEAIFAALPDAAQPDGLHSFGSAKTGDDGVTEM